MNVATTSRCLVSLALTGWALAAQAHPLDQDALTKVVRTIDDRQRNSGDYRSLAYLEQKERDKTDTAREAIVYRRSADEKLMILFTKPKGEAGKGYLRLDKNLWSYDPPPGSGSAGPSGSGSPAPTAGGRTSTSRGWRRSTTRPSPGSRSWAASTPG
jgi:hypothetical protein